MTLEDLLRMEVDAKDKDNNDIKMTPDFRVAVQRIKDDRIHFIIHPIDHNGETLDLVVKGNELMPLILEKGEQQTIGSDDVGSMKSILG